MKKINYIKILLDSAMVIIFTLLFNKMVLGMTFHEIGGLAIGFAVLVHCGLNWKWIKEVTKKLFSKNIPVKTKIGYIINALMFIDLGVIIVTGIFISKVVFAGLNLAQSSSFKGLHVSASYSLLVLMGVHVGLHWDWIIIMFKKVVKIKERAYYKYIARAVVTVVLVFGIYNAYSEDLISKINIFSTISTSSDIKSGDRPTLKDGTPPTADGGRQLSKEDIKGAPPSTSSDGELVKFEGGSNNSVISEISTNLSILSVFSIIIFYIEKISKKRKRTEATDSED